MGCHCMDLLSVLDLRFGQHPIDSHHPDEGTILLRFADLLSIAVVHSLERDA